MKTLKLIAFTICMFASLASCKKEDDGDITVAVNSVSISQETLSLLTGEKATLRATVLPENATDKSVRWSSNATSYATVDAETGEVTAIASGTAEITVTTKDGNKTAKCVVTVSEAYVETTGIELNKTELVLMTGDEETLIATVKPDNASNKTVTWSSDAPEVAAVDAATGKVTALRAGEAAITASVSDKQAVCAVTVVPAGSLKLTLDGYTGTDVEITYTDNSTDAAIQSEPGVFLFPQNNSKVIRSIKLGTGEPLLIGRKAGSDLTFKVSEQAFVLRDEANGSIPVGSYAEFQLIATDDETLGGNYKQEADLDLLSENWTPVGTFSGVFDGNGFTLANLKITAYGENEKGLFNNNAGTLSNIQILSGAIAGQEVIGSVCGVNTGTIAGCSNLGCTVSGTHHVGGVCGNNAGGTIRDSYNKADVSASSWNAGGVCGRNWGDLIACYNTGSVSNNGAYTGGVCGGNGSNIIACYNTGSVYGAQYSNGGVSGHNENNGKITACYSIGQFSGGWDKGGVCGRNQLGTIAGCYYKAGVGADFGIGGISVPDPNNPATTTPTDENALPFTSAQWPAARIHAAWGTGNGSENQYWKSLGSYNSGEYPQLWFEP